MKIINTPRNNPVEAYTLSTRTDGSALMLMCINWEYYRAIANLTSS